MPAHHDDGFTWLLGNLTGHWSNDLAAFLERRKDALSREGWGFLRAGDLETARRKAAAALEAAPADRRDGLRELVKLLDLARTRRGDAGIADAGYGVRVGT
jgi:hypothetical protein